MKNPTFHQFLVSKVKVEIVRYEKGRNFAKMGQTMQSLLSCPVFLLIWNIIKNGKYDKTIHSTPIFYLSFMFHETTIQTISPIKLP